MAPSSRSSRILLASTLGFVCFSVLRLQGFFFPEQLPKHHQTASQRHHQQCRDREKLMKLLKENSNPEKCRLPLHLHKKKVKHVYGMTTCVLSDICDQLPKWKPLQRAYGESPRLVLPSLNTQKPIEEIRVYGLPGTTDMMLQLLRDNFLHDNNTNIASYEELPQSVVSTTSTNAITIAVVRDPFRWMASLCHSIPSSDTISWMPGNVNHCPNLVPSPRDPVLARKLRTYSVLFNGRRYESLAAVWSRFAAMATNTMTVVVRWEDLLMARGAVLEAIGGKQQKAATVSSTLVRDWNRYGPSLQGGRYAGMEEADVRHAKLLLRPDLLRLFGYMDVPDV